MAVVKGIKGELLALVPKPEEARVERRYRTSISALLISEQGERVRSCLSNISLSGIQLQLGPAAVQMLMPATRAHDLHQPVHFQIEFCVPTSQCLDSPVHIDCTLIYCRRHSTAGFVVGAKFCEFQQHSDLVLRDYIESYGEAY